MHKSSRLLWQQGSEAFPLRQIGIALGMAVNTDHKHANGRSSAQLGNLFGEEFEMHTYSCFGMTHYQNVEIETGKLITTETEHL
jgi:hypothetical protein